MGALEAVAEALMPRFRPLLDEVAGVSQAGEGGGRGMQGAHGG